MKVLKLKRRIEIDKTIGNFHIGTFHYGSYENDKLKHWTELHCWYECDCEHCPLSWEVRGYDDVDCGCYMAEYGDYPKTDLICMLPRWIKKILLRYKKESEQRKMKEQWIVEAEQNAKDLAEILYEQITDDADDMCIDRKWYFEKVIQYMRAESEE